LFHLKFYGSVFTNCLSQHTKFPPFNVEEFQNHFARTVSEHMTWFILFWSVTTLLMSVSIFLLIYLLIYFIDSTSINLSKQLIKSFWVAYYCISFLIELRIYYVLSAYYSIFSYSLSCFWVRTSILREWSWWMLKRCR